MGIAKINWPIIIAVGEKRMPKKPSGPCREIKAKTKSPTTTVGKDRRVLKKVMVMCFPGNCVVPMTNPRGTPIKEAKMVAEVETHRERKAIPRTSWSNDTMRLSAWRNPSRMKSTAFFLP
jgi:hypothetical protein